MTPTKKLIVGLIVVGLIVGAGALATNGFQNTPTFVQRLFNKTSKKKIAQQAVNYINTNVLTGKSQAKLSKVMKEHGLYKIDIKISDREISSYVTKDGKLIFPQAIEMATSVKATQSGNNQNQPKQKEIPKTEKPKVELFVMSFCPYGNKAEKTIKPVYELLQDEVDWNIHYIVSKKDDGFKSLHGEKEVTQNKRELCVLQNQNLSTWFHFATYVNNNCGSNGECWQTAAEKSGLSTAAITNCSENKGDELLAKEAQISSQKKVSGSPTLFINGVESKAVYEYNNPNAYKEAICSGFKNKPSECNKQLATANNNTQQNTGGSCE